MATQQMDYAGRLPYGLWYGPESGTEYLFDRGYNALASRPVAEPWRVTLITARRFIDAGPDRVQDYYYNDRTSPRRDKETLAVCEKVLAYFCLGRDVRYWLDCNRDRDTGPLPGLLLPKTHGKYLPYVVRKKQKAALTFLTPDQIVQNNTWRTPDDLPS